MKEVLRKELDKIEENIWGMSDHLYENPELGDQEFKSMELLVDYLQTHDFLIESGIVDRPTAFRATYKGKKEGPTIAFLAEYDALPDIGHGCGHNMIGTMSVGAGVILSKIVDEVGGTVIVLGTPAEETNGAKVAMSDEGIFEDVDVAMIVHPAEQSYESGDSLAMDAIEFKYTGKSSHAAASPEKGINALDSVIQLFNGINALREHVPSDVRMHGVISEGGKAANIVPDKAVAQFYLRAGERSRLNDVVEKVTNIANGAATMTGASLEISNYELSYDNMITNQTLSDAFTTNLLAIDKHPIGKSEISYGSIDMGNVSQVVPAIHPYLSLNDKSLVAHTVEFANQTITRDGHQAISTGILAMASTAYDVLTNKKLLNEIKKEFEQNKINKTS